VARWQNVADTAPEFAKAAQAIFDIGKHKTMASLRKDGSPRISGIEVTFSDGDVWVGMMPGSLKARDVGRDPRIALHSPSIDPPEDQTQWRGDAKLSGRAVAENDKHRLNSMGGDGSGEGHLFRIDIDEVVVTRLGEGNPPDHLVIELWLPGQPLKSTKRY
jgi:hypothetical protein